MNRKEAPYYFLDENMDDLSDDDVSRNRGQEFECEEDRKAYHNALERKRRVGLEKQLQKLRNAAQVPSKTCKIGTLKCASKFIEEKQHAITKHFQEMAQLREENEILEKAVVLMQQNNCSLEEAMRIARAEVNFNCQDKIRSFSDVPMKEVLDLYKKDLRQQGLKHGGRLDVSGSGVMAGVSSSSSQRGCGIRVHSGHSVGKTGPSLGKYGAYSGVCGGDEDSEDSMSDDDIDEYMAGNGDEDDDDEDDDEEVEEEEEIEGIDELGDVQVIRYQEEGTSRKVVVGDGSLKLERGVGVQADSDSYGSDGSADDEFFLEDL